jgi:hypothetical protein
VSAKPAKNPLRKAAYNRFNESVHLGKNEVSIRIERWFA